MEEQTVDKKSSKRYITRLRMENFQSHKDADFEFSEGINLITGSSDAGKSAILRAINFVFHNQPRSKAFVRKGTTEARVTIWFNDGTEIQRIKGDRNCVVITKPGDQSQVFEKIGNELPPEALEALGNPPIDEKHGPLSFSEQMAPYFLVSLSPTELPRSISELTGISHFEEAAQILGKQSRQADRQAKEAQERLSGYEIDLESYVDLDTQLSKLNELEVEAAKAQEIISKIDNAENLKAKYELVMSNGRKTSKKLKRVKAISIYEDKLTEVLSIESTIKQLDLFNNNYLHNISAADKAKKTITKLKIISNDEIVSKLKSAKDLDDVLANSSLLLAKYKEIILTGRRLKNQSDKWQETTVSLTTEYNSIVDEVKAVGEWCEICERPAANGKKCKHTGRAKK